MCTHSDMHTHTLSHMQTPTRHVCELIVTRRKLKLPKLPESWVCAASRSSRAILKDTFSEIRDWLCWEFDSCCLLCCALWEAGHWCQFSDSPSPWPRRGSCPKGCLLQLSEALWWCISHVCGEGAVTLVTIPEENVSKKKPSSLTVDQWGDETEELCNRAF